MKFNNTDTIEEELQICIDGLALKQSDGTQDWLPNINNQPSFSPYQHQVKMQELIENKNKFIAMNTTITGGGKTYSYAVPSMRKNLFSIIVFPTNALTEDQKQGITDLAEDYFPDKKTYVRQLTSDSMQEYRDKNRKKGNTNKAKLNNGEQIRKSLIKAHKNNGPSFILTNPDILLGILRGNYNASVRQQLELADMLVIDEFHNARPKGKNSLIIALDELYHRNDSRCNLKKFVLLSATPDETVEVQLKEHFGLPDDDNLYHRIDSTDDSKSLTELNSEDKYNPVMPKVETTFISSRPFQTKNKILHPDYLLKVLDYVDSGRSIIILDGVAEVNDVYIELDKKLPDSIRVDAISGLRNEDTAEKLQKSDVIVANSTVEVGIDIGKVENLIFTGFNASRFMQRLGRLRAEKGLTEKRAICFTTPDMIKAFETYTDLPFEAIPREMLEETVNHHLGSTQETELCRAEFTPVEMYRAIEDRAKTMYETEENYRKNASQIVAKHCFATTRYELRKEDIQRMWNLAQSPIGDAMQSYRQSSLTTLVYDNRKGCKSIKTYSITGLLRFGDIEFVTELEFKQRMKEKDIQPEMYDSQKQYVQAYAILHGSCSEQTLRNPQIKPSDQIKYQLSKKPMNREPLIIDSLSFHVDSSEELVGLSKLNKQIQLELRKEEGTNLIGYATEGHPAQIQTVYDLDEFFFTNPICDLNGEYTLSLGENAIYLYCHVQENIRSARSLHKQYMNPKLMYNK